VTVDYDGDAELVRKCPSSDNLRLMAA
jgi:hypothetical protein